MKCCATCTHYIPWRVSNVDNKRWKISSCGRPGIFFGAMTTTSKSLCGMWAINKTIKQEN